MTMTLLHPKDRVAHMLKIKEGQFTLESFVVAEMGLPTLSNLLKQLLLRRADLFADHGSMLADNKVS